MTSKEKPAAPEPTEGMLVTANVRLVRPLGEGGMGSVWVADHLSLRTQVVVKFMARELAQSTEATARFSREAAAASQVKSPHVVQMLDHGVTPEGTPYIVMELLEGRDLDQHLHAAGRLKPQEAAAVLAQLARALTKAHEREIVHRDIKPSNVFLCDAGGGELFVKLLDFGIAKGPEVAIAGSTTRTGAFVGSPYYMSPEQVVGSKDVDYRSDLWSLGALMFEALTGQKPFYAETVGALALKIHRDPLPKPSAVNPALPMAVDDWFQRACAREAQARFGSAKEMAEALAVAVTGEAVIPALRLESVPALQRATGFETTEQAPGSPLPRALADAKSETGEGVGLASRRSPQASRGRWFAAGGAAVLVVGAVVFLSSGGHHASEPTIVAVPTTPPSRAASLAMPVPSELPSVALAPVEVPPPAASSVAVVRPAPQPTYAPPRPRHSAPASVPAKPPGGSDDDIK